MTNLTSMDRIVRDMLNDIKRHHGSSWSDMSPTQQEEKLAAKLFFMVCQIAPKETTVEERPLL